MRRIGQLRQAPIEHCFNQAKSVILLVAQVPSTGNDEGRVQQDHHQQHGRAAQSIDGSGSNANNPLRGGKDDGGRLIILAHINRPPD